MPVSISGDGSITGVNQYVFTAPSTSTTPFLIQGIAGQTADLLAVKNSAGTNLFQVTAAGQAVESGINIPNTNDLSSVEAIALLAL